MNRPLLLAAALACALAAPALAHGEEHSIRVERADLNLQSESGAAAMLNRLESASKGVCGVANGRVDLTTRNVERACVEEAMADAIYALDAPLVTALYEDRLPGGGVAQGDAQP
ncbi:MAG: UrcA family protein [Hydrogenophilaceae bacterium]|jgi:UrcA family protein|nr:UrcA family protein [Hydrogenophilaceae bacterium]